MKLKELLEAEEMCRHFLENVNKLNYLTCLSENDIWQSFLEAT